jgi:hypothetical protein
MKYKYEASDLSSFSFASSPYCCPPFSSLNQNPVL